MEHQHTDPQIRVCKVDKQKAEIAIRDLLYAIGEDPDRPGLVDTPRRSANFWSELIDYDPGNTETTFESVTVDQMVVVSGIRVWSLCEHHLLPFWCDISIGYIARERVLGLSKFARIAHQYAHGLQIQERLVHQIAGEVKRIANTEDVAVRASGVHLCMVMRGIKTEGVMTSSVLYGSFRHDPTRHEFLEITANTSASP